MYFTWTSTVMALEFVLDSGSFGGLGARTDSPLDAPASRKTPFPLGCSGLFGCRWETVLFHHASPPPTVSFFFIPRSFLFLGSQLNFLPGQPVFCGTRFQTFIVRVKIPRIAISCVTIVFPIPCFGMSCIEASVLSVATRKLLV